MSHCIRLLLYKTLLPAAVLFFSCNDGPRTIKMKGSDTEVNLAVNLAEAFSETNHHFSMAISGGGSGLGIAALLNGEADIANSSRPLTEAETNLFSKKGIILKTIVFAEDATAFVVHKDHPLSEINLQQLAGLMNGDIANWQSIASLDLPVNIYGRQSSSGTYSFIRNKLNIQFSPSAKEMTGNAQIIEAVKMDKSGIGYVGAGYISKSLDNNQGVKVLKIKSESRDSAVSPLDPEAIRNKIYFFQRPLYQFIPAGSWDKVAPFIEFETKGAGREIIERSGYYLAD